MPTTRAGPKTWYERPETQDPQNLSGFRTFPFVSLLSMQDGRLLRVLVEEEADDDDVSHRKPEVQVREVPGAGKQTEMLSKWTE